MRVSSTAAMDESLFRSASTSTTVSVVSTALTSTRPAGTRRSSVSGPGVLNVSVLTACSSHGCGGGAAIRPQPTTGGGHADRRATLRGRRVDGKTALPSLLSALREAGQPIPRRTSTRPVHRTRKRTHEPGVHGDALAIRGRLDAALQPIGQPQRDAGGERFVATDRRRRGLLFVDIDELGILADKTNLDA